MNRMKINGLKVVIIVLVLALVLSACGVSKATENTEPVILTVMTHDSFAASEEVIAAFEV